MLEKSNSPLTRAVVQNDYHWSTRERGQLLFSGIGIHRLPAPAAVTDSVQGLEVLHPGTRTPRRSSRRPFSTQP